MTLDDKADIIGTMIMGGYRNHAPTAPLEMKMIDRRTRSFVGGKYL
jgi:hypothetical protein